MRKFIELNKKDGSKVYVNRSHIRRFDSKNIPSKDVSLTAASTLNDRELFINGDQHFVLTEIDLHDQVKITVLEDCKTLMRKLGEETE